MRLDKAVDKFAKLMKEKLHQKADQGYSGWDNPGNLQLFRTKMLGHAARLYSGDEAQAIDVANLAMMCMFSKNNGD